VEQTERQLPLRRAESAALFILVAQAVGAGLALLLGVLSRSAAAEAEGWHLAAGLVVWLAAFVHQRLRRLATEEALTAESLKSGRRAPAGPALFEPEGADLLTARNRLAQFERFFLPAFSLVIILVLGGVAYYLLRRVGVAEAAPPVAEPLRNFWAFAGIAFVSFLLAKYAAGLATQAPWRPLRPAANYLMSCALASLLVAVAFVFCFFEVPVAERVVAWAIPVALATVAAEMLLLLVMGLYRPRVAGEEARPAHDSRLLGMLTTSRGILRTTAETLDYQFGFKVSETWFYRFMERALGPLIVFQALTLGALSSFVIVETGHEAVVERLGRPRAGVLGPGLHLKWPWPIEIAYAYPTQRVEVLAIGEQLLEDVPGFVWTQSHAKAPFNLLTASRESAAAAPKATPSAKPAEKSPSPAKERVQRAAPPVSLIVGTVYVFYYVSDLHSFLYNYTQPKRTLETLCYRELSRYTANADFLEFLGHKRLEAVAELKRAIQAAATERGLGVAIVDVTLQGLHPPVEVAGAFEEVVGALEQKEAQVWEARKYRSGRVPGAQSQAARVLADAEIYKADRVYVAPAVAGAFEKLLGAYRKSPSVFRHRKLLSTLEEALAKARRIIKPAWVKAQEVIHLNLEEKTTPGQGLSIDVGPTTR